MASTGLLRCRRDLAFSPEANGRGLLNRLPVPTEVAHHEN